ncbi:MAG TPA: PKD domain-containing protein, partial [Bacteroidia bacterium]|nr:PKD domain-containing protein [Bacteroidia bacterium]
WLWDFGDGNISDKKEPFHLYTKPGYYKVTLTGISTDGCSDTLVRDSAIHVIPGPVANFIMDSYEVNSNRVTASFKNLSVGATELYWTFGNGNFSTTISPVEIFNDTGKYTISLSAFNEFHCFNRYDLTIHLLPENDFYIPNAFTPNEDPLNQEFKISGNYFYTEFEMFVYNRWGELVFYSNNPDFGWKGNYKDRPAPDGVYTYQVRLTSTDRKIFVYKGTVHLLR